MNVVYFQLKIPYTTDCLIPLFILTMHDPMTVVKAGQWIRVCNGAYKGDIGFVMEVETWGVWVLVVPCLKRPTALQVAVLLKQK